MGRGGLEMGRDRNKACPVALGVIGDQRWRNGDMVALIGGNLGPRLMSDRESVRGQDEVVGLSRKHHGECQGKQHRHDQIRPR
jgi:hypothetical protein